MHIFNARHFSMSLISGDKFCTQLIEMRGTSVMCVYLVLLDNMHSCQKLIEHLKPDGIYFV